jgi:hypothetical protein
MADFYESHLLAPAPMDLGYGWMNCYMHASDAKEILQSLGSFTKRYEEDYFRACVQVGEIELQFSARREAVCQRKIVGTRIIPAQTVPSSYTEEKFIPEHEEEIVEWDCGEPILAKEGQ